MTIESMMAVDKSEISEQAGMLKPENIEKLVEWLSLKEDDIRFRAFLLLQAKSRLVSAVYPFWDVFRMKLRSDNSYQRSLGVMLISENVQWDKEHKMQDTLAEYLEILKDEKPITVRQCIQALGQIVQKEPGYSKDIAGALVSYDIMSARETMRKSILIDIINTLLEIRKNYKSSEIDGFIFSALDGEILDAKSKKTIQKLL
jgi:hypothetical protein